MGDLELRGGSELAGISRKLRRMSNGKEIRKQFTKELRRAGKPLVPKARAATLAIPATSGKHSGLRKRLARATRLSVKASGRNASVSVIVDGRKMPAGEKALPAYMEGTKRPWRHPVYGSDTWVKQEAKPYFYSSLRGAGRDARKAIGRVIDSITRDIT